MSNHTTNLKTIKSELHARNQHRERYDFAVLANANPALAKWIKPNAYGDMSIDFANPTAVKALNKALLKHFYSIEDWDIPAQYLCPPIPGRADYMHNLADLLNADFNQNSIGNAALNANINVLDIGVGANMIYPLIGYREYGWQFVGADIDAKALQNAQKIIDGNALNAQISLRLQPNEKAIFKDIIQPSDAFTFTLCNPPFHASMAEAVAGTRRKLRGLNAQKAKPSKVLASQSLKPTLNFGGQNAELYCEGGELAFLRQMMTESRDFANQCIWFTTLVSKATNLPNLQRQLKTIRAVEVKIINMQQGQKQSRILAWSFLTKTQRAEKIAAI